MSLIRTSDVETCGITNIPLTKPARLFFVCNTTDGYDINKIYSVYESLHCEFTRHDLIHSGKTRFISKLELESKDLKMVWRNWKSLYPKFETQWRYFFWELDGASVNEKDNIIEIYKSLRLPVYVHKTMGGYHFLSVKPIPLTTFQDIVSQVRKTNVSFPAITLRIMSNKYIDELEIFNDGYIISDVLHNDTFELRNCIYHQNIEPLLQKYQIVYYSFNGENKDRFI